MAGRSGIERITSFDPSRVDSKVAGEIRGFEADEVMPKKEVRRNDRYVHYAWAAAAEAMRDAGLDNPITDEALAERTGVIVGSGIGGINTMIRDVIEAHDLGIERVGPFLVTALIPDMGAGYIAIYANARGPNYATVSACSSSNHAIGDALNIIRRGEADVMIAGRRRGRDRRDPGRGLRRHARAVDQAQRRPIEGLASVRRRSGRLRHGRWCRRAGAGGAGPRARRAARGSTPRWSATPPPTTRRTSPCRRRAGAARSGSMTPGASPMPG